MRDKLVTHLAADGERIVEPLVTLDEFLHGYGDAAVQARLDDDAFQFSLGPDAISSRGARARPGRAALTPG